jgi:replicative DNA helicase
VPVLALSQLSRAAKDARGKIPVLGDLRDSGALEQDADQVIFVWQHEDPEHHIVMGRGVFVVAKARMGKVGKQAFTFRGAEQTFVVEGS